jgi:hypothetical protein
VHPNVIVQAFPPATVVFTGIGVLLTVRVVAPAIRGLLLTPTFTGGKRCESEPRCARRTLSAHRELL